MNKAEYIKYLGTEKWRGKAEQRMAIDDYTCQCCGSRGTVANPLETHHLTYRNIGDENVYLDLVTLCKSCHSGIHRVMSRVTDAEGGRWWKTKVPDVHTYTLYQSDIHTKDMENRK